MKSLFETQQMAKHKLNKLHKEANQYRLFKLTTKTDIKSEAVQLDSLQKDSCQSSLSKLKTQTN